MTLLWRLAAECPAVLLEANFRTGSEHERQRVLELSPSPVEVYCRVPSEVAAERYSTRGASRDHHEVHVVRSIGPTLLAEFEAPFGLGPVIEVATTEPVDVNVVAIAVHDALGRAVP